ncbi:helix-turn-helix domain-containing protein [Nesterenkonia alba]|uniref:helix-turn-helix domain-containing protein n=1 Tax=Nesterenkonia alba TaxID=515814 RepID=UPI0003B5A4C6|nr:helix-turn-helix domain-containing protein [Nesterenkonia alba]
MSGLLDAAAVLRQTLEREEDEVTVTMTLPRSAAVKVLDFLEAEASTGATVVPARWVFTTTEAAQVLGMSRSKLMLLIKDGEIESHMVGSHHRVTAEAIAEYRHRARGEGQHPVRSW